MDQAHLFNRIFTPTILNNLRPQAAARLKMGQNFYCDILILLHVRTLSKHHMMQPVIDDNRHTAEMFNLPDYAHKRA